MAINLDEKVLVPYERMIYDAKNKPLRLFSKLSFSKNLEDLFETHINQEINKHLNTIFLIGVLTYFSFFLIDYLLSPINYKSIWMIRTFLFVPFLGLIYLLSKNFSSFKTKAESVIIANAIIICSSNIPLLYYQIGDPKSFFFIFMGYTIFILFAQGFIGLRFTKSLFSLLLGGVILTPFVNASAFHTNDNNLMLSYMILTMLIFSGLMSLHQKEYYSRITFLDACLLKIESKKLKDAQEDLKLLADTDSLTGLYNRRTLTKKFDEIIEWSHRTDTPFSCIIMDIDYFKLYNDYYGHQKGDRAIRLVADTIIKTLKRATDVAARYGGEEFILLLPQTDQAGAMHIAEDIRKTVEGHGEPHEKAPEGMLTLSMGVYTLEGISGLALNKHTRQEITEKAIGCADNGLYQSKQNGRNRTTYYFI